MKILILNGSPKGDESITLQYAAYIQKHFPEHEYQIVNVSQQIKKIERDQQTFQEIIEQVRSADGVLWSFGLWVLCVPAQYMRFIELISERGEEEAFKHSLRGEDFLKTSVLSSATAPQKQASTGTR